MQYRKFGRTGLTVSEIGFGCGGTGAVIVSGSREERREAVSRAIELGLNYFDTAPAYGNGLSETNLGETLQDVKANVIVSTKVRPRPEDMGNVESVVMHSVEESLKRLRRDQVDIIQVHNHLTKEMGKRFSISVPFDDIMAIAQALKKVQAQGKARFIGFTALGEPDIIHKAVESGLFDTVQVYYNILQPSAGYVVPDALPVENYDLLLRKTTRMGLGTIGVRVLAGGVLTNTPPSADLPNWPVMSQGNDLKSDLERAKSLDWLLPRWAATLQEAAMRFVLADANISTALIGFAGKAHVEEGVAAVERGPLSSGALALIKEVWKNDFGRKR